MQSLISGCIFCMNLCYFIEICFLKRCFYLYVKTLLICPYSQFTVLFSLAHCTFSEGVEHLASD